MKIDTIKKMIRMKIGKNGNKDENQLIISR